MSAQSQHGLPQALTLLKRSNEHTFTEPAKKINDGDDLNFFLSSTAYRDLTTWLLQLNRAVFPTKDPEGNISTCTLVSPPIYSQTVKSLQALLQALSDLIELAPAETGPRRFGNVAFRTWYRLVEQSAESLIDKHLSAILSRHSSKWDSARTELKTYLLGSFGSAQRLDYGTGHELSFLAFLAGLWKLDAFSDGEERSIVVGVVQPYLELVRRLIMTYTLEPAGSHGVWGLDDHSFIPYVFGSAQLGPPISSPEQPVPTGGSLDTAPEPSTVTSKPTVVQYKDENMYFSAIQFIYSVKRGPFWEHSPILYDISGIKDGWGKINKGMLKMYAAEVLGKFPVVQHFPFGRLFAWETDLDARGREPSLHALQQPVKVVSRDVPIPPPGLVGTQAPWGTRAKPARSVGVAMGRMQAAAGMPTTGAPWATNVADDSVGDRATTGAGRVRRPPPPQAEMESMPAPRRLGNTRHLPPGTGGRGLMPTTTAPWASKEQDR